VDFLQRPIRWDHPAHRLERRKTPTLDIPVRWKRRMQHGTVGPVLQSSKHCESVVAVQSDRLYFVAAAAVSIVKEGR